MNTQERSFETLIAEANEIADARTKKANELKDKFYNEILPQFAESMSKLGAEAFEFCTREPVTTLDYYIAEPLHGYYVQITNKGELLEADKTEWTPEGIQLKYHLTSAKREDLSFLGTLELCEQIPGRLKRLIEKAEAETEKATSITDEL